MADKETPHLVTISEAKANLSALLRKVEEGQAVVIGRAGTPIAVLVSYRAASSPRVPGALKGKIRMADDFDELPGDIARAFGIEGE